MPQGKKNYFTKEFVVQKEKNYMYFTLLYFTKEIVLEKVIWGATLCEKSLNK